MGMTGNILMDWRRYDQDTTDGTYVTEDGSQSYVTEDGTSPYVPEA